MRPGHPEAVEFEYEGHGTQALIANVERSPPDASSPPLFGETRTEADFLVHIEAAVALDAQAQWIFVCDQLNTHQSASLVEFVAQRMTIETDLGRKEKDGILKSMASRAAFFRITRTASASFIPPKHCSWLNQVLNLVRHPDAPTAQAWALRLYRRAE